MNGKEHHKEHHNRNDPSGVGEAGGAREFVTLWEVEEADLRKEPQGEEMPCDGQSEGESSEEEEGEHGESLLRSPRLNPERVEG